MYWEYLLSGIYIGCFLWLVPRVGFIKNSGLSVIQLRSLLIIKMLIAYCCAWYFANVFVRVDYMGINEEGILQYRLLVSDPVLFFTDFTGDVKQYGLGKVFDTSNSFWGYFRFILVVKLLGIANVLTKGNFYLNSILFSSLIFFGHIAFYRVYNELYPGKKLQNIFVCFFIPSLVLYTSCVHKDGFVFLSIGIASYIFYCLLQYGKIGLAKLIIFFVCLFSIFLFRNYVLVALLPAMFVAFVAGKITKHRTLAVLGMYMVAVILFFATGMFDNSANLPAAVVKRKADFALLEKGSTDLEMKELTPHPGSFLKNIPTALNHVLLRPYPTGNYSPGVLMASFELYFYLALVIAFLVLRRKHLFIIAHPFNIYGFSFFICMMLIIGFTIPNAGAIIRYRSLIWIFVLCPLVCNLVPLKKPEINTGL